MTVRCLCLNFFIGILSYWHILTVFALLSFIFCLLSFVLVLGSWFWDSRFEDFALRMWFSINPASNSLLSLFFYLLSFIFCLLSFIFYLLSFLISWNIHIVVFVVVFAMIHYVNNLFDFICIRNPCSCIVLGDQKIAKNIAGWYCRINKLCYRNICWLK